MGFMCPSSRSPIFEVVFELVIVREIGVVGRAKIGMIRVVGIVARCGIAGCRLARAASSCTATGPVIIVACGRGRRLPAGMIRSGTGRFPRIACRAAIGLIAIGAIPLLGRSLIPGPRFAGHAIGGFIGGGEAPRPKTAALPPAPRGLVAGLVGHRMDGPSADDTSSLDSAGTGSGTMASAGNVCGGRATKGTRRPAWRGSPLLFGMHGLRLGEILRVQIGNVQEAVLADAEIDKGGLNGGLDVGHAALVDIANVGLRAGGASM